MSSSSYKFTLKQERLPSYYRIELLVVVLHLLTFIVFAITRYPKGIGMSVFGITTAAVYLIFYYLNKEKQYRSAAFEVPIFIFALLWFNAGVYWLAVLIFIFSSFALVSKKRVEVLIDEEKVCYKSFPNRSFNWDTLNNVILKDGMLTIDFKNNKIIQQLITENNTDEAAFNQFCRQQQTINHKPQTPDS